MPNWIGDAIMATPLLEDIRGHFPAAEIHAMCQSNIAAVVENNPYINEVFSFNKPNGWLHRLHHFEVIDTLRCGHYDLGILTTNSLSSAWWFWRGHVKNRLGFKGHCRRWLLDKSVPLPCGSEKQHLVLTYKQLLFPLGIPLSNSKPALFLTEEEKQVAVDFLANLDIDPQKHIIIGINPGAAYGSAKCWLPDRFKAVARQLVQNDKRIRVLFFGDPSIRQLVISICTGLPDEVIDLAGKTTLRGLMALIDKCSVLLTNDSGPMHIAAALQRPIVALFGSTNPTKTGPYSDIATVLYKKVACSPCYKRVCPIDMPCMTEISVEEVLKAIYARLTMYPVW